MQSETFFFDSSDGAKIFTYKWLPDGTNCPKAVIQISHGMAEHAQRYERFAKELANAGFAVYANDHRGHGKTAIREEDIGYLADERGWEKTVDDMHALTRIIKKDNPDVPVFLLGHSMGSFLSRNYAQLYGNDISGLILSGTSGGLGIGGRLGRFIARREAKKYGRRAKSLRMKKLLNDRLNGSFQPARTDFDWLSRDPQEVDRYIDDAHCGEALTNGFYCDMLEGMYSATDPARSEKIPDNLPIYLISGTDDPVGQKSRGVLKAYRSLVKAGLKDVSYKLYEGARHEILNEINRDEVYQDILAWINKHRVSQ